jgi:dTDP-4-dehydrorhamnose 3,5-epimerase-like enzyme
MNSTPKLFELDVIKTPDGFLTPVYKDWEDWHAGYEVKMVYHTSIGPGISKGPILHERRRGLMSCISGDVSVVCLVNSKLETYKLSSNGKKFILMIPENTPNMIINNSKTDEALIMNLPDKSWHPNDEDTIKFSSWDDVLKYNSSSLNTINSDGVEE